MGGTDKVALRLDGRSLLDRVLAAARPLSHRLVVVGPRRPTALAGVEFLSEASPGGGPVPAVLAAVDLVPEEEIVLVLAADLPFVTPADLERLVETVREDPGREAAAAADHRRRPNPLLAAYRASWLRAAGGRGLGHGSAAAGLLPPGVATVALSPLAGFNVNSPDDLRRAADLLAQTTRWSPA